MVFDNALWNVLTVYATHSSKMQSKGVSGMNRSICWVVPHNEMVVLAGDINGHVGSGNIIYDGIIS